MSRRQIPSIDTTTDLHTVQVPASVALKDGAGMDACGAGNEAPEQVLCAAWQWALHS